ncbi:hypothetical protein BC833DRAFT_437059 [Globomyces pollinis-pini]|nr:hypothetical protein BC833DRAFT_437059 [Globomyces pollinis-pini]
MTPVNLPPNTDYDVKAGNYIVNFTTNDVQPKLEGSFSTPDASPNFYPYDQYNVTVIVSSVNLKDGQLIPVALGFSGTVDGWFAHVDEVTSLLPDNTIIVFSLIFRRSTNSKIFSVAIILIMWALSITALTLSVTLWFRDRKVEPPTIGFIGSLLFALPQLRNNLPGTPLVGCIADTLGFFFNMALIALSMLILMWNYINKYKREKYN